MKTTGIIAEYNPFHNGHKYHIEEARRITGADYIIIVMSGDFCQRGIPAVADKYLRTEMALKNGADLVLELPVRFSTASAEFFAYGSAAILDGIGVTDFLCFGSECNDIALLSEIADLLLKEPEGYKAVLKKHLKNGLSFPRAREQAILSLTSSFFQNEKLSAVLASPNNILAVEYLKALKRLNSRIKPCTILRRGAGYHDLSLKKEFSSASGIRVQLARHGMKDLSVPESVTQLMEAQYKKTLPVFADDFSALLHYRLLTHSGSFSGYQDGTEALSDKIRKKLPDFCSFTTFADNLKSKEITHSRISRFLMHILLGLKTEDLNRYMEDGGIGSVRILGFRENASPLLSAVKKRSALALLGRLSAADTMLLPNDLEMIRETTLASHIYQSIVDQKFGTGFRNEYSRQFLKL